MPTPRINPDHPRWPDALEAAQMYEARKYKTEIAAHFNVNDKTVARWIEAVNEYEDEDGAITAAKDAVGTNMRPSLIWAKTKSEDGTSYSALLKPDPLPDETLDRIKRAFEGIKPAPIAPSPERAMRNLCTLYPLMDVHLGMKAWGRETGGPDYDLKLAAGDMRKAFSKVSTISPDSHTAILLIGGDFFHQDDSRAETPKSRHKLDVDGRHFKIIDEGVALLAGVLDRLLRKHRQVVCRVLRGNHDEHSHMVLTFALHERYRDEPRLKIEKDPRDLFLYQWGKCLISAHHGDKAKPERLTLFLSDVCPFWSDTRHRFCFTGHVHHDQAKDTGPLKWESLRAFCPPDSYAAGMGFASRRAQQAITFDKQDGLILRAMDPIER